MSRAGGRDCKRQIAGRALRLYPAIFSIRTLFCLGLEKADRPAQRVIPKSRFVKLETIGDVIQKLVGSNATAGQKGSSAADQNPRRIGGKSGGRLNAQGGPCVRYASRRHLDRVLYICRWNKGILALPVRTVRISPLVQWLTSLGFNLPVGQRFNSSFRMPCAEQAVPSTLRVAKRDPAPTRRPDRRGGRETTAARRQTPRATELP